MCTVYAEGMHAITTNDFRDHELVLGLILVVLVLVGTMLFKKSNNKAPHHLN